MMATAGKDSPEYKKLFAVQAELADALGDHDGVALRLANKLLEMGVIGKAIRDAADIRGPHVTEIMRVNPIIKAMLSNIDLNPTMRYQEFRNALLAPAVGVSPDVVKKYLPAVLMGRYCCGKCIEVTGDIFKLKTDDDCSFKILEPLSPQLNYYECVIVDRGSDPQNYMGVGAGEREYPLNDRTGYRPNGIGYHANNGNLYESGNGKAFGPTCTEGDRMGCGVVFDATFDRGYVKIFFTKNGMQVGKLVKMRLPTNGLYPIIGYAGWCIGGKVKFLGYWKRTPEGN